MDKILEQAPWPRQVAAIPAKAEAHRALICAALSGSPTFISCPRAGQDIWATVRALQALGSPVVPVEGGFAAGPFSGPLFGVRLDCGLSASTLRLLLPLAAALCPQLTIIRGQGLKSRPLAPLTEQMALHGAIVSGEDPLVCRGLLQGDSFLLPGHISSQFASGLLLALTRLGGELRLIPPVESRPYIDLTLAILGRFGGDIRVEGDSFVVRPQPALNSPGRFTVGGDWSDAAFFLIAGLLGKRPLTVTGLDPATSQGDKAVLSILRSMGGRLEVVGDKVTAYPSALQGAEIDVSQHPDLAPALAMAAAAAAGESHILRAGRLRLKESDRLQGLYDMLIALGGRASLGPDSLTVYGGPLRGGVAETYNDHRLVMSAAVAALLCQGPVTVRDSQAADKSHAGFWEDIGR